MFCVLSDKWTLETKDSLKFSSKIKLILKSLCWTCMYFYINFKIKRSGLITHSLSFVVRNSRDSLVRALP